MHDNIRDLRNLNCPINIRFYIHHGTRLGKLNFLGSRIFSCIHSSYNQSASKPFYFILSHFQSAMCMQPNDHCEILPVNSGDQNEIKNKLKFFKNFPQRMLMFRYEKMQLRFHYELNRRKIQQKSYASSESPNLFINEKKFTPISKAASACLNQNKKYFSCPTKRTRHLFSSQRHCSTNFRIILEMCSS